MIHFSHNLGFLILALVLMLSACKEDGKDDADSKPNLEITAVEYDDTPYLIDYKQLPVPDFDDNPPTNAGVKLGRMLFYDTKLSRTNTIACANCHQPSAAFSDFSRLSIGVDGKRTLRHSMALFNLAWHRADFFWDGRAATLHEQALLPIQDENEMDETLENVVAKLRNEKSYRQQFYRAFKDSSITVNQMALALEQFMFTLVSNNSKYDQYLRGEAALSEAEERGRALFFTEFNPDFPSLSGADCVHCHGGHNFDSHLYMNNGLDSEAELTDLGRFKVTGDDRDKGKFKVTSLRNIALTAPYMHDGRIPTLREAVEHYNAGLKDSETLDPALKYALNSGGFKLSTTQIDDLIAFLNTLTDQQFVQDTAFYNPW